MENLTIAITLLNDKVKNYKVNTAYFGAVRLDYICRLRKHYLVAIPEGETEYKIVRPLTWSEIYYVNPFIRR